MLINRRRFLKFLGGLLLAGTATYGYARQIEPHWVDLETIRLPLPTLPAPLVGKRLAHISDLHLGPYFLPEQLQEAIALINQSNVDWLMMTGDYATPTAAGAAGLIEPLRLAKMPIYASFGNHDYWSGLADVRKFLKQTAVVTLLNAAVQLEQGLWVAGVDDLWSGRPNLKQALQNIPTATTTLLLAHEPDFIDQVEAEDAPVAVQLSGHSHGGQVRIPTLRPGADGRFSFAPCLPRYSRKYPIGLRRVGNRYVYTNRGLGVWPLPYRINCRPEITIIELVQA